MAKRLVLMICFVLSYCVPRGLPHANGVAGGARFVCGVGAVGIYGGGGGRRASAGGRDGIFSARRARRAGGAAEDEAGFVSPGRFALRDVFAADEKLSAEHGGGSDADVRGRRAGAMGKASDS